jgi:hypothetical protein
MDLHRISLIILGAIVAAPALAADGGAPDWVWSILGSEAGITAVVVIASGVLAIVWPPAGAFFLRLLPIARQIPTVVDAIRRDKAGRPTPLSVADAAERATSQAGPVSRAAVKVVGKKAVRRLVAKAASRGDIPKGSF